MTAYHMLSMQEQLERMSESLRQRAEGEGPRRGWANKPAPVTPSEPVVAARESSDSLEPQYACPHCKDIGHVAYEVAPHRYETTWCSHCSADKAAAYEARETGLQGDVKTWRLSGFHRRFGPAAAGLDAARKAVKEPVGFVTFHGGYGSGKSHLLAGICNELHDKATSSGRGRTVHYTTLAGLLDYLRQAFDPQSTSSYTARYDRMLRAEVLAIDEVEKVSVTQWADEKLFQLLDDRYRRAAECLTVLATNERLCDRDQAGKTKRTYPILPASRYAGAIMSRLLDGRFLVVDMGNEDVRPSLDRDKWLKDLAKGEVANAGTA